MNPIELYYQDHNAYLMYLAAMVGQQQRVEFIANHSDKYIDNIQEFIFFEREAFLRCIIRFVNEILITRDETNPTLFHPSQSSIVPDLYYIQETDRLIKQIELRGFHNLINFLGKQISNYRHMTIKELRNELPIDYKIQDITNQSMKHIDIISNIPEYDGDETKIQCRYCHSDKVVMDQLQTSSGDEAMTVWIQCQNLSCKKRYRYK